MKKGNVLVIGNSGVGKSTLINAVFGRDVARTGYGSKGTTKGVLAQSGGKADKQGLAQLILALFLPASEEKAAEKADGGKAAPGGR